MTVLALVLAILGPVGVGYWTFKRFEGFETAPAQPVDLEPLRQQLRTLVDGHNAMAADIDQLEDDVRDQKLAIAEGIERVDRAERRVRAAVGRAKKRMEELGYVDEGVEAEAAQLRALDGDGGEPEGVPAVSGDVAARQQELQAILSSLPGDWS